MSARLSQASAQAEWCRSQLSGVKTAGSRLAKYAATGQLSQATIPPYAARSSVPEARVRVRAGTRGTVRPSAVASLVRVDREVGRATRWAGERVVEGVRRRGAR